MGDRKTTAEPCAGQSGRITAGTSAIVLAAWELLTFLAAVNAVQSPKSGLHGLLYSAMFTVALTALAAGITVIVSRWKPAVTALLTFGVFALVVNVLFFYFVAPSLWSTAGIALCAAVLYTGQKLLPPRKPVPAKPVS
ncbi:hypothetical protein [Arthrobacter sp. VKM Ac-2550]|uniref:hypothetical protein n=1 Tax=Crystallibacter permensis TaxID=1938888 RepID=UPI0022260EC1|nr:hypothetical protein [Arthrobacter sp. VKM Ac-2550]MCW2135025.1 hypothetical protein [Arthrobacter sp. VKM Ac-2550]